VVPSGTAAVVLLSFLSSVLSLHAACSRVKYLSSFVYFASICRKEGVDRSFPECKADHHHPGLVFSSCFHSSSSRSRDELSPPSLALHFFFFLTDPWILHGMQQQQQQQQQQLL